MRSTSQEEKCQAKVLDCGVVCGDAGGIVGVAQDEKNEIGGAIGRIFISDQGIQNANYLDPTIHSGKGLSFEGEYARRILITPIFSVSGEVPVLFNLDEDLNAGSYGNAVVPSDYQQIFVTPAVRLNLFPTTAFSPWVSFGGGFGHFSENNNLDYGGTNPGKATNGGVIQGGFGLDVSSGSVCFRGEYVISGPGTGFSLSPDRSLPAAQLFRGRRLVLAVLEAAPHGPRVRDTKRCPAVYRLRAANSTSSYNSGRRWASSAEFPNRADS